MSSSLRFIKIISQKYKIHLSNFLKTPLTQQDYGQLYIYIFFNKEHIYDLSNN